MDSLKKWNRKYQERLLKNEEPTPNERLVKLSPFFNGGNALDLACGLGGNSMFLSRRGYHVAAVDISDVAIGYLQEQTQMKQLSIHPYMADLTDLKSLEVMENAFDLVVITYYLDRAIFPMIHSMLKAGGYFFMETFYISPNNVQKVSDSFKLKPNELLKEFGHYHVLYYEENEQEGRQTILCRK